MLVDKRAGYLFIGIGLVLILAATWGSIAAVSSVRAAEVKPELEQSLEPLAETPPPGQPAEGFVQHEGQLIDYVGAASCQGCHSEEVHTFSLSNHYLWKGKLGALNDFCGYPDINLGPSRLTTVQGTQVDGGCAVCHAGMGEKPTTENPLNADCLLCHAKDYRRTVVNVDGKNRFVPNRAAMPAVISIQKEPERAACLTCHQASGGGNNNKRGDMSNVLANPTVQQDVHMGNGMSCVDCHQEQEHRIAGRGVDLSINEGVPMRACTDCHTPEADHSDQIKRHLAKVACQSCHIPTYARAVSTDMLRDYQSAEVNERGLYEPTITRQSNVIPEYAFWNGTSRMYVYRQQVFDGQALALPLGSNRDGKLYPFKLHQAILPQEPVTRAIIPAKAGILFQTGNTDLAIRTGGLEAGFDLSQGYAFTNAVRWMGIFHEMPAAENALQCADCHDSETRIDFTALGYTLNSTRNGKPLCTSCHEPEEQISFYGLHDKHVRDENVACTTCHTFTPQQLVGAEDPNMIPIPLYLPILLK